MNTDTQEAAMNISCFTDIIVYQFQRFRGHCMLTVRFYCLSLLFYVDC